MARRGITCLVGCADSTLLNRRRYATRFWVLSDSQAAARARHDSGALEHRALRIVPPLPPSLAPGLLLFHGSGASLGLDSTELGPRRRTRCRKKSNVNRSLPVRRLSERRSLRCRASGTLPTTASCQEQPVQCPPDDHAANNDRRVLLVQTARVHPRTRHRPSALSCSSVFELSRPTAASLGSLSHHDAVQLPRPATIFATSYQM